MPTSDALDAGTPVAVADDSALGGPILVQLMKEWPTAEILREEMYKRDLERASVPPVINVTMTDPGGHELPGHYSVDTTGPNPVVAWHEEPAPELTIPMSVTGPARKRLRDTPPMGFPAILP